jgi:4-aminobutyrate aminotransferase / (S)-3-amino-2-methylpropionate transaminase / 5-aminovalerate transaminase
MTTNADLLTRRNAAVVRGIGHTTPLSASRARNAELWDVEGKRYVDFAGGIAVVNTGHCHPRIIAAVQEQMERFTHTCFQVAMYEPWHRQLNTFTLLIPVFRSGAGHAFSIA